MERASLWRRLGAMLYDAMIVVAIWMATTFLLVMAFNTELAGFWWQSFLFVEWFAFFIYFWCNDGQTVGMMAWRLRVLSDDGTPLSVTQATTRFAVGLLSAACLGLGYLWALVEPLGRSWGDIASGSHVIVEPKRS